MTHRLSCFHPNTSAILLTFPESHPLSSWTRKGRKSLVPPQAPMSLEYAVGIKHIYNTFHELWHPIWCLWPIPEELLQCWNIFGCPQTLHISSNSKHCNLHCSVMPQVTIVSFTTTQPISLERMYKCAINLHICLVQSWNPTCLSLFVSCLQACCGTAEVLDTHRQKYFWGDSMSRPTTEPGSRSLMF